MDNNERLREDEKLDEALDETFPASDPPANTPETGIRINITPDRDVVVNDNRPAHRFEACRGRTDGVPDLRADA